MHYAPMYGLSSLLSLLAQRMPQIAEPILSSSDVLARGSQRSTSPSITRTAPLGCYGAMETIPPELVPGILKFLALDDLRRAAAVSRLFYESAWRSGLFIPRRFHWYPDENNDAQLATLTCIVEHSLLKRLRLGLAVTVGSSGGLGTQMVPISGSSPDDLLSLISRALPIIVNLAVSLGKWPIENLAGALCVPAPQLLDLDLAVDKTEERLPSDLPCDLLSNNAPQLRHVALRNVHLGRDALAAFSHVVSVRLEYISRVQALDLALHFPRLRSLHLSFFKTPAAPPPDSCNLDALGLQRLAIDEYDPPMLIPAIMRSNTLIDIPAIEYAGDNMRCGEPIWHKPDDGDLRILLSGSRRHYEPARVVVVAEHRRWRRVFMLHNWRLHWNCPIFAVPRVSERLTHLRMHNLYIVGLLECRGLSLNALRELRIDLDSDGSHAAMLWPPDWADSLGALPLSFGPEDASTPTFARASYSTISCCALETLVLAAVSAAVSVQSQEVAFLGRALCQCLRHKPDRAALDLVGVELREPVAHTLLDQTFSTVRRYGFADTESPPLRDDGFWGDELP